VIRNAGLTRRATGRAAVAAPGQCRRARTWRKGRAVYGDMQGSFKKVLKSSSKTSLLDVYQVLKQLWEI